LHQALIVPGAVQAQVDPTVFLMGRPTMSGSINWLRAQTIEGKQTDVSELARQWREAHAHVMDLTESEPMIADGIAVTPLPDGLVPLAEAVLEHSVTKQSFGTAPVSVGVVELGKLVVFQRNVNLTYAGLLQQQLGANPSPEDVFHFVLPTDGRYDPASNAGQVGMAPNAVSYAMVSPSNDLRVLQAAAIDPNQIVGWNVNGRVQHVVAVAVGYGSNYLSAMRVDSRLILKNGTHRAYALLASGQTHAPMLVEDIPTGEEREHLPPDVQADMDGYLKSPRPPLLSDCMQDDLRVVVHVPRTQRTVRVNAIWDESGIPV
jgi:hypothetical protein